jgi:hypothetical protein
MRLANRSSRSFSVLRDLDGRVAPAIIVGIAEDKIVGRTATRR